MLKVLPNLMTQSLMHLKRVLWGLFTHSAHAFSLKSIGEVNTQCETTLGRLKDLSLICSVSGAYKSAGISDNDNDVH